MFSSVLIANRGCIAVRIIRTLRRLNIRSIVVYHESDADSLHVRHADCAVSLGEGSVADTYLNIDKILAIAAEQGAEAIHPGYGFLSENAEFVSRCEASGIVFIGPTSEQITMFGLKHEARELAEKAEVPLVPGTALLKKLEHAVADAERIGYPVMLKSTAGGGGIGMKVCFSEQELLDAWDSVKKLGTSYFSNDGVFLEKFIANARHIEVQVFGDGRGQAVSLGERDCSAQRRNQKVVEESPAPHLTEDARNRLYSTAEKLMASVQYRNAGTVEFIYDADSGAFYFLEVNTRLQVEHGVTEEVWQVDLVEWMLQQAAGELDDLQTLRAGLAPNGHAIQVRLYAEDVHENFLPSPGFLSQVNFHQQEHVRIDTWVQSGTEVPSSFDPMVAKLIAWGSDRQQAIALLSDTLAQSEVYGTQTNLDYLRQVLDSDACQSGTLLTRSLAEFRYRATSISVLEPGTMTTIQDFPGRTGYWHVGVPPSGPMDSLHFRLANRLLGNDDNAAALEITLNGPSLRFNMSTVIAICGANLSVTCNGRSVVTFSTFEVSAGDVISCGQIKGTGARAYLAVKGGIQCPDYLGSCATFTLGRFGGHNGRALQTGDVLSLNRFDSDYEPLLIEPENRPAITSKWEIRVIYGPHGAPDFFTDEDISAFFGHEWEVHYNSSRTGVRLIGPKPKWARNDGGEAGLHPSNIHDNAYAFGTIDFTGDMPVILGPDGPSLGGFVCPATVIEADLWKLGQLSAGAKVRFIPVSVENARREAFFLNEVAGGLQPMLHRDYPLNLNNPVVHQDIFAGEDLVVRLAGDQFVLIELGEQELDIERRLIVHALMGWIEERTVVGILELTPGIRSLQVHYQPDTLSLEQLLELITAACREFRAADSLRVPTRIVHLPLSWDDRACREAIKKYMQSVREDAPWCPSNLEFIRRINGLDDISEVKDIVFSASYLVMGLGDVYLGAPVATPLDPRQRLITTKYNPARTWTAENSVGIGGAYLCVYGMEGPGGYQFVGRTLQMWNRYQETREFTQPWLLRFFDQIRFFEVSEDELTEIRRKFPQGQYPLKIEEAEFDLGDYRQFLKQNRAGINAFQQKRSRAFAEELEHWKQTGQLTYQPKDNLAGSVGEIVKPPGATAVYSPASGNVWSVKVSEGKDVEAGQVCLVLESMKMEIDIPANAAGRVIKLLCREGEMVRAGQELLWIE